MDWKQITQKILPYTDKMSPYIKKAKIYGIKAIEFAEDQIQMTPLFVRTQDAYNTLLTDKRVVIIAYDETHAIAGDIRLLSSVWLTRAFMDTTQLRFISMIESADLSRNLGFSTPLDMRVRFEGEETLHLTDITAIKQWWQSPVYKKIDPIDQKLIDPLAVK
ncbi:hypothetical protein H7169_03755 [Candidatus Gracilibacteria bacterium]|nr:hypothetical protein [Candidatus Gracilibacteria bacterium]